MVKDDYYDETFYLRLTLSENKVSVQYVTLFWDETKKVSKISEDVNTKVIRSDKQVKDCIKDNIFNRNSDGPSGEDNSVDFETIVNYGRKLGDVLLPDAEISDEPNASKLRNLFIEKWRTAQKGVRLCLLYSDQDRDALLSIPWEYVYVFLPRTEDEEEDKPGNFNYFLALRSDISIAHCLKPDQLLNPEPLISIDDLRVQMKYLSWFGSDESNQANERAIFNSFVEKLPALEPTIECTNIKGAKPGGVEEHQARATDLTTALQNQQFVQVSSHGGKSGIVLKIDDKVFLLELEPYFKNIQEANQIKVVILLSCLSGAGGGIARQLHLIGVPVVVAITGLINIKPASRFVSGLYTSLVAWPSHGLEKAVAQGRKSIVNKNGGSWSTEFGYPRLFLYSQHSTLIPEEKLYGENFDGFDEIKKPDPDDHKENREKLKNWIMRKSDSPQRRWFLVEGRPGSGKTTQIKLLLQELDKDASDTPIVVCHFCQDDKPESGDPLTLIRDSLFPQFDSHPKLKEKYRGWCRKGKYPVLVSNAEDALRYFVIEPLLKLKEANEEKSLEEREPPPVIVIDGLDYIPPGQSFNNSILQLLLRYRDELDDLARFLVTSESPEQNQRLSMSDRLIQEAIHRLTYHQYESSLMIAGEDTSINGSLPLFQRIQERLVKSGIEISSNGAAPKDLDTLLRYAIATIKKKRKNRYWARKVNQLLDVVTLSPEPLRRCDVETIIDVSCNQMDELLNFLKPFFDDSNEAESQSDANQPIPGNEKLILFHHRIKKYLFQNLTGRGRDTTAHKLIVNAVRPIKGEWGDMTDWSTLYETKWQKRCTPNAFLDQNNYAEESNSPKNPMVWYVWRYLAHHAYELYHATDWSDEAARQRRAGDFLSLICDPDFRTIRFTMMGREAALQDIWNGLRVVYIQYALFSPEYHEEQVTYALHQLISTNASDSLIRDDLIQLEERIRHENGGRSALFEFLGLNWPRKLEHRRPSDSD